MLIYNVLFVFMRFTLAFLPNLVRQSPSETDRFESCFLFPFHITETQSPLIIHRVKRQQCPLIIHRVNRHHTKSEQKPNDEIELQSYYSLIEEIVMCWWCLLIREIHWKRVIKSSKTRGLYKNCGFVCKLFIYLSVWLYLYLAYSLVFIRLCFY